MGWRRVISNLNRLRNAYNMIHEKRFVLLDVSAFWERLFTRLYIYSIHSLQ